MPCKANHVGNALLAATLAAALLGLALPPVPRRMSAGAEAGQFRRPRHPGGDGRSCSMRRSRRSMPRSFR